MRLPADPQVLLPYLVIALVMVWRWRSISRPRPLRAPLLIAPPLIVAAVAGLVLTALPPVPGAVPVLLLGALLGAAAGWQRSRLMRLERDAETGSVVVRNSPWALLLILALLAARKLFLWEAGVDLRGGGEHGTAAMLAIRASLGFAVGLVWASRIELWRRAQKLG